MTSKAAIRLIRTRKLLSITVISCTAFLYFATFLHTGSTPLVTNWNSHHNSISRPGLRNGDEPRHSSKLVTTHGNITHQHLAVARRFQEREARVREVCASIPRTSYDLDFLFYAASHNLFVCASPKVGSSTWLTHLLKMSGYQPPSVPLTLHSPDWKNIVMATKVLGWAETRRRLQSAVSVMTSRHPLARLVSAFRDKFAGGRILEKPQSEEDHGHFWKPILKALHRKSPPFQVSFAEFVRFAMFKRPDEPHWQPLHQLCYPCDIHYRYVMHMETFTEDLHFLVTSLNISAINLTTSINQKPGGVEADSRRQNPLSLDTPSLEYYLQLPLDLLDKVITTYALDFELFGYEVPPDLVLRLGL